MASRKIDPRNREECDRSRVTLWRELGYDGTSVTVASFEDLTGSHGSGALGVIQELAPGARVLSRPRPLVAMGDPVAVTKLETFFRGLVADGVNIITYSVSNAGYSDELAALEKRILVDEGKMVLLASAGNEGSAIKKTSPSWWDHWWAVGAAELVTLRGKRVLQRDPDSNIGARLDIMAFTNIYRANGAMFNGTSCAAPFLAAMLAIYYQFFKEKAGRFPTPAEAWGMLKANAEDMEDPGFDNRTAIGLARLPAELPEIVVPGDPPPAESPPVDIPEETPGGDRPMGRPRIYLSPSTQAHNLGVGDYGTEEFRMRQLAWDVGAILTRQGADVAIARVDLEPDGCVAESDAYKPLYHISLHSNSVARGVEGFYWPGSARGSSITRDICNALGVLNPNGLRRVEPDGTLTEIAGPDAVCAYIEVGAHDCEEEAKWIVREMDGIAFAIAEVICRHLGLPAPSRPSDDAQRKLAEIRKIVNS